jgi:2-oxoglutarate dehydrogenase E1 component
MLMTPPNRPEEISINGANVAFLAGLYARYLKDKNSVDPGWAAYFAELQDDPSALAQEITGASWTPHAEPEVAPRPVAPKAGAVDEASIHDSLRALMLIRSFRVRGHLEANLDPLGLMQRPANPELDPATYGFSEADYDRPLFIAGVLGLEWTTLREIVSLARQIYCGTLGIEFMHIQDREERYWLQDRIESGADWPDAAGQREILHSLTLAEGFEKFLQVKYTGTKRFGLEGGESLIPAIDEVLKASAAQGVREVVFGMAHRGRLNVLTNFLGKKFTALFSEFQGNSANPDDVQGSGDVKYHLGTSTDREVGGKTVHLSLTSNPSHLEAVNPVVLGKTRAKQDQRGDAEHRQVMGLLIHGDAAMAGQGLVAECFALECLKGYHTGGTMHLVINNQIGFTTLPEQSRSGPYSTDVAKMVQAPIFHVNGDDPDAVVRASRLAAEFRHEFQKDVVVDIVCYRRQGHNEGDEPAFTQPIMYKAIRERATTRELYAQALAAAGTVSAAEAEAMVAEFQQRLETDFAAATGYKPNKADWLEGKWAGFAASPAESRTEATAVEADALQIVGKALVATPDGFDVNPKILRQLKGKEEMFASGQGIDWATGEALAFGTLLLEGHRVRLSGQDCGRGTFSQRHAVLYDQQSETRYVSLNHIAGQQAPFEVLDSPLSEAAVLGFEYGYALAEPRALVLWEGQFGDFANGAQVIIDQFISSGESKWLRMCGLVMLLPHGYEGQGPEHSSARLERYLQLCAEDNMQVANCTTPANYFHILRRQLKRNFRKPLVLMTPKSLLRHKLAVSALRDFTEANFQPVIGEAKTLKDVKRVVLCSGKVYYDLLEARQAKGVKDVALVRVEQLYPFPDKELAAELAKFPKAEVVWCQEEPENMGAWTHVDRRIEAVLNDGRRPVYVGRPAAASPATGLAKRHAAEQMRLVEGALVI